jgi:hypothetical protein
MRVLKRCCESLRKEDIVGEGEGAVALGENVIWVDWNAWGGQRSVEFQ